MEPKRAALERAIEGMGSGPATLGAGSWWADWPVVYRATRHPHLTVVTDGDFDQGLDRRLPDCWIELEGTPSYERRAGEQMAERSRFGMRRAALLRRSFLQRGNRFGIRREPSFQLPDQRLSTR